MCYHAFLLKFIFRDVLLYLKISCGQSIYKIEIGKYYKWGLDFMFYWLSRLGSWNTTHCGPNLPVFFVNTVLLEYSDTFMFVYCLWLLLYYQAEWRPYDLKSLKYLLLGPLKKSLLICGLDLSMWQKIFTMQIKFKSAKFLCVALWIAQKLKYSSSIWKSLSDSAKNLPMSLINKSGPTYVFFLSFLSYQHGWKY